MFLTLPLALQARPRIRVEIFLAVECPISNRYIPELKRIVSLYQPKGVDFLALFPEARLTEASLEDWRKSYEFPIPVQLDPLGVRAEQAGATLTPEVVVFLEDKLIYRGRIDDRYVSWGKSRPAPTRRDLADTLQMLLDGKTLLPRFTKSWGCFIEAR
ncbi:hypothetical protein [Bryobacter aggregatus]|uniref:hypothetical protein n=1 Tax=Bryobacter aggregatus TaxID=360054 RepID=UPI0004E15F6F|nr:hypothetical protein [Bryobacter aggregatus]